MNIHAYEENYTDHGSYENLEWIPEFSGRSLVEGSYEDGGGHGDGVGYGNHLGNGTGYGIRTGFGDGYINDDGTNDDCHELNAATFLVINI